jgi:hypothetical protein
VSRVIITSLLTIFASLVSTGCAAAAPKDGKTIDGEYYPGPRELTSAARKCGLKDDNFRLSTDEDGVTNIDVAQGSMSPQEYKPKMQCFFDWALMNNAAAGVAGPKE